MTIYLRSSGQTFDFSNLLRDSETQARRKSGCLTSPGHCPFQMATQPGSSTPPPSPVPGSTVKPSYTIRGCSLSFPYSFLFHQAPIQLPHALQLKPRVKSFKFSHGTFPPGLWPLRSVFPVCLGNPVSGHTLNPSIQSLHEEPTLHTLLQSFGSSIVMKGTIKILFNP